MLGSFWSGLLFVALVAGVLLRDPLLFMVSLALLLGAGLSGYWAAHCLDGVTYRRQFSQVKAAFGDEIDLTVEVVNGKPLPLPWLEAEDEVPRDLAPMKGRVLQTHKTLRRLLANSLSLRWYERVRRRYHIRCGARGEFVFGPVTVRSGDVFGFLGRETTFPDLDYVLVYPKIVTLPELGLPPAGPFGDLSVRRWLFHDPLRTAGVREYRAGDPLRQIHWKATAKAQELRVKINEPSTSHRVMVVLNVNTEGPHWWWQGYDPDILELAITAAASVVAWAMERGFPTGLAVNGAGRLIPGPVSIEPGRAPGQLTEMMETLARITPYAVTPMEKLLHEVGGRLPYGCTVVVISAKVESPLKAELLTLRRAGHQVTLLVPADAGEGTDPVGAASFPATAATMPGVRVHYLGGRAAWRRIVGAGGEAS